MTGETTTSDLRLAGTLALVGGILAAVGNVLHPFFDAEIAPAELLEVVATTWYWTPLHLLIGLSLLLVIAAFVVAAPTFQNLAARQAARIAAVIGAISGGLFAVQLAGIDGIVFRYLADRGAPDEQVALMQDLDVALLSLSITTFMGITAAVFGIALLRDRRFAPWLGWLAVVAGVGNTITGLLQSFNGLTDLTLTYLFRPLAALVVVVIIGYGVAARRIAARGAVDAVDELHPARTV